MRKALKYYELDDYVNDAELFALRHKQQRLGKLLKYVDISQVNRTLEVGCGSGIHAVDFQDYVGLDISLKALKKTKLRGGECIRASADNLPFRNSAFGLVVAFNVIEHLFDPESFLKEVIRVCRDGAFIIISSPQHERLKKPGNVSELLELLELFIRNTMLELLARIRAKRRLLPKIRQPDYSRIGRDADAVYLTNFCDIACFLRSTTQVDILNAVHHPYFFWLKHFRDEMLVAKLRSRA